jgi:hypothetical protein
MDSLEILIYVWIAIGLLTSVGIIRDEWHQGRDQDVGSILMFLFCCVIFAPIITPMYLFFVVERFVKIPNVFDIVIIKGKRPEID